METVSTTSTVPAVTPPASVSLKQRFLADTPTLFKITQLVGVFLVAVVGFLLTNGIIPVKNPIAISMGAVGATMAVISGFVVKDFSALTTGGFTLDSLVKLMPQLMDQFNQVNLTSQSTFVPGANSTSGQDEIQQAADLVVSDPVIKAIDPDAQNQVNAAVKDIASTEQIVTELKAPATIG